MQRSVCARLLSHRPTLSRALQNDFPVYFCETALELDQTPTLSRDKGLCCGGQEVAFTWLTPTKRHCAAVRSGRVPHCLIACSSWGAVAYRHACRQNAECGTLDVQRVQEMRWTRRLHLLRSCSRISPIHASLCCCILKLTLAGETVIAFF